MQGIEVFFTTLALRSTVTMLFMAKGGATFRKGGGDFQRSGDGGSFSFVFFEFLGFHFAQIH